MITIQLLGPPQIYKDTAILPINRRKSRALVYYLAAQSTPIRRDQILTLLWPDHPRESAQQTLRTTLTNLRQVFGSDLVIDYETASLRPTVNVDVHEFENGLNPIPADEMSLVKMLELYRGPFLEGFTIPDETGFENWAIANEEYFRRLAIRAWTALSSQREDRQDYTGAIQALDQALTINPLQEEIYRDLLRCTYLSGDRPLAIQRYEDLVHLLDEELGVPPMRETRDLYESILNEKLVPPRQETHPLLIGSAPRPAQPETLPFTGRAIELAALLKSVQEHHFALLTGEAGAGKTRLAVEFLNQQTGLQIRIAGRELEQTIPYLPFFSLFQQIASSKEWLQLQPEIKMDQLWWSQLARLAPELSQGHPSAQTSSSLDETRLWEAVSRFLQSLARQIQVSIFFDDLHWADSATIGLLGYLVNQNTTSQYSLNLIGASQAYPAQSSLGKLAKSLTRDGSLALIQLVRLSRQEIQSISAWLSPKFKEPLAHWLEQNSEGNPFVLAELVRYAKETGILTPDKILNLNEISSSPVVPDTIFTLISARLQDLSDGARQVLDTANAIGREFNYDLLVRASPLPEERTLDALDELSNIGLIHPGNGSGPGYRFDHSLVMEVAWKMTGDARHRNYHRRVAEALLDLHHNNPDAVAGLIARHFSEGLVLDRARQYAHIAARQAERLSAWDEASEFYRLAIDGNPSQSEKIDLMMGLGEAQIQKGENVQAEEVFQQVIDLATQVGETQVIDSARLGLARTYLSMTRLAEVIQISKEIIASGKAESHQEAEFLWGTALSIAGDNLAEAELHLNNSASLNQAGQLDDRLANQAHIEFEMGNIAAQQGNLDLAVQRYHQSLQSAKASANLDARQWEILSYNNLAYHSHLRGDPQAESYAQAGITLANDHGILGLQSYLFSTLGEIRLNQQDRSSAEEYFLQGLNLAKRFGIAERVAGIQASMGRLALAKGNPENAVEWFQKALTQADILGTRRLSIQIRLWMAPLVLPDQSRIWLIEAREIASAYQKVFLPEIEKAIQDLKL